MDEGAAQDGDLVASSMACTVLPARAVRCTSTMGVQAVRRWPTAALFYDTARKNHIYATHRDMRRSVASIWFQVCVVPGPRWPNVVCRSVPGGLSGPRPDVYADDQTVRS